jgi:hypothetical protein
MSYFYVTGRCTASTVIVSSFRKPGDESNLSHFSTNACSIRQTSWIRHSLCCSRFNKSILVQCTAIHVIPCFLRLSPARKKKIYKRTGETKCTHKHVVRGFTNPSMLRQSWSAEQKVRSSSHETCRRSNLLVSMNFYVLKADWIQYY